jgi:sugar (pentulose or hexulose) kinase
MEKGMPDSFIAVIDVGKTNKKILVFDSKLKIADSAYKSFDEYVEDGVHYESVEAASKWMMDQLAVFSKKYRIKALSITTHGATVMCIDRDGNLALPPVAYTTDAGPEFDTEFHKEFGSQEVLQKETGTARIGSMINEAKILFYCKKRWPDRFEKVYKILHYPQYFGYLFTGRFGAEPTYTGCHTYLFDPVNRRCSSVAEKLGIAEKIPATISKSWEVLGTVSPAVSQKTGLKSDCIVTMGIHDSNSSLLPYLVKGHKNFVLNSTGTWCVAMHPTDRIHFENHELGKMVFFNLDAFFNPVKTSIFMGGLEYDTYTEILRKKTGACDYPEFDLELYSDIIAKNELFILPSISRGTGIFPDSKPRILENGKVFSFDAIKSGTDMPGFFCDYKKADAVLVISLALQTKAALKMAGFNGKGTIFTEGGFRKNTAYNAVLAALYPQSKLFTTSLKEATAFGAAILARAALDKKTPMETAGYFEIEQTEVKRAELPGLKKYEAEFTGMIGG